MKKNKHYTVEAEWVVPTPIFNVNKRTFRTTRKREAVAKAAEFWNEKLSYAGAKWVKNPTVAKVESARVTASLTLTTGNGLVAAGDWGAEEWK